MCVEVLKHTGIFAKNSFQIDSINWIDWVIELFMYDFKKVEVLTENCCKYSFFTAKTNKVEIMVYFGNNEKIC